MLSAKGLGNSFSSGWVADERSRIVGLFFFFFFFCFFFRFFFGSIFQC